MRPDTETGDGARTVLHLHFASDASTVSGAIDTALASLRALALSDEDYIRAEIVLVESLNNIVEHAYMDAPGRPIELAITVDGNALACRFVDQGVPMPNGVMPVGTLPRTGASVADLPEGGFGWGLIRGVGGQPEYRRDGNRNHFSVRLDLAHRLTTDARC